MSRSNKQAQMNPRSKGNSSDQHAPENARSEEELLELEAFFSQLGEEDVRYKLYRVQKGGKRVWLEDGTPETFSEAAIQESHGEGDYLIRAISGRHWIKSKQISIGPPSGASKKPENSDHVRALELRLREVELQAQQARDAEMNRQHELTMRLIEGIGTQPAAQTGPSLDDLITGVRNLRDLSGNNNDSLASVRELLEVVNEVNALRGDKSEDNGILSLLKPVVPDLARLVMERGMKPASGGQPSAGSAPAAPPLSRPHAPVATSPSQAGTDAGPGPQGISDDQFQAVKKEALSYALSMARMGRPAGLYADMAIETVDLQGDPVTARLIEEIVTARDFDSWFTALQALEPGLVTQRDWFQEFFDTVREGVGASTGEAKDTTTSAGADHQTIHG